MEKRIKDRVLQIRISEYDLNKLKMTAKKYAEGSMTDWIMYAIDSAPREFLKKKRPQLR